MAGMTGARYVRTFALVNYKAQEGVSGRETRQVVEQGSSNDNHGGQEGRRGPEHERVAAIRDRQGQVGEYAEGHDR
jgi:hypothetical protein